MALLHETTVFNVKTTLNRWFVEKISEIELPFYFGTNTFTATNGIVFNWPEKTIVTPTFSLHHMPVNHRRRYQGDVAQDGLRAVQKGALLEINAWVSRDDKYNGQDYWDARLQYMQGMVEQLHVQYPRIVIRNFLNDPAYPAATEYLISLGDLDTPTVGPDANPSIRRSRSLIRYDWTLRAVTQG